MNQAELIKTLAGRTVETQACVSRVLGALAAVIQSEETVDVPGLGKFGTKERAARKGRNPKTGETMDIPAKTVLTFKPSKALRDAVA